MVFSHKTAKFAPVWTIILKIRAVFVHQSLTEHALTLSQGGNFHVALEITLQPRMENK